MRAKMHYIWCLKGKRGLDLECALNQRRRLESKPFCTRTKEKKRQDKIDDDDV